MKRYTNKPLRVQGWVKTYKDKPVIEVKDLKLIEDWSRGATDLHLMHLLSKSTYMRGKQCPKALWLYKHRPALRPEVSVAQQAIFESGTEVQGA